MTRKIVQEHGGSVQVESDPGQGATFFISLPSDRAALGSAETRLPRPLPSAELDEDF